MDSTEKPKQPSKEGLAFNISQLTINMLLAKTLILLTLTLVGGYFFAKDGVRKYEMGSELTQEEYLEGFDDYKASLLNAKQYENRILSTFVMLIVVSFFIGSYELTALIIGFIIGKLINLGKATSK